MEILAKNLRVGHVLPNGSWGQYRLIEVTNRDGRVTAVGQQGKDSTYTFYFSEDQTTWLA